MDVLYVTLQIIIIIIIIIILLMIISKRVWSNIKKYLKRANVVVIVVIDEIIQNDYIKHNCLLI